MLDTGCAPSGRSFDYSGPFPFLVKKGNLSKLRRPLAIGYDPVYSGLSVKSSGSL
jgi:hypothetical protein